MNRPKINIDEIRQTIFSYLTNRKANKRFNELAFELEYYMLLEQKFPEEVFKLYSDILSDEILLTKKGTSWFAFHIYNDFEKISPEQLQLLKQLIVSNYHKIKNEDIRYVVMDIVNRKLTAGDRAEVVKKLTSS